MLVKSARLAAKWTRPRAPVMVRLALGRSAVTPAQIEYRPRDSSAIPTLIAAAMLRRVQVFLVMSNTSVVSTDSPSPITVFVPAELSVNVPPVAEM